jgi:SAM-dependent methyltransferase
MNQHLLPLQAYYGWRLERGENTSAQLGWEDPVAHYERFRVLTSELDVNYRTLLDVGSGLGDLWFHLAANGLLVRYLGVDILPEMVNRARERFPGVRFECRDVIADPGSAGGRFDIIYSAGIFNLAAVSSEAFLRRAFEAFTGLAERHVALSLLHTGSPDREDEYLYFDPAATVAALSRPGWELRAVEGYLRNDFTIIASREEAD